MSREIYPEGYAYLLSCGQIQHEVGFDEGLRSGVEERDVLVLEPGEVTCFDLRCKHSSSGNTLMRRRE